MIMIVFGLPRSGKTTYLARYIKKYAYKYNHIYISGETLDTDRFDDDFITYLHPYEVGTFEPIHGSLFVMCEAGTYYNNRLFASIPTHVTDFFAGHGHYECDIIMDSQSVDVDLKARQRADRLYVCVKSRWPFGLFATTVTEIRHKLGVRPDSEDLADTYHIPQTFLQRLVARVTFRTVWMIRPFYYGIFDTHSDMLFHGNRILPKLDVFNSLKNKSDFKKFNEYERILNDVSKNANESGSQDESSSPGTAEGDS